MLLSRMRLIDRFRSILGSCLRIGGTSMCIANSGTQFLSGSMVARFHNHNFRVEIRPLSFHRVHDTGPGTPIRRL